MNIAIRTLTGKLTFRFLSKEKMRQNPPDHHNGSKTYSIDLQEGGECC